MSLLTKDEQDTLVAIKNLLAERMARELDSDEDVLLQWPSTTDQMQVAANTTITPVNRRINRRLKFITISIPENCVMIVYNNNLAKLFFNDESGTIEFPHGLDMGDVKITLTNTGSTPARCNYRLIFSE